jgi:hypothetical protein
MGPVFPFLTLDKYLLCSRASPRIETDAIMPAISGRRRREYIADRWQKSDHLRVKARWRAFDEALSAVKVIADEVME